MSLIFPVSLYPDTVIIDMKLIEQCLYSTLKGLKITAKSNLMKSEHLMTLSFFFFLKNLNMLLKCKVNIYGLRTFHEFFMISIIEFPAGVFTS